MNTRLKPEYRHFLRTLRNVLTAADFAYLLELFGKVSTVRAEARLTFEYLRSADFRSMRLPHRRYAQTPVSIRFRRRVADWALSQTVTLNRLLDTRYANITTFHWQISEKGPAKLIDTSSVNLSVSLP